MENLLATLSARGMLHDSTPALAERLQQGPITGYAGFDPTASSLHVGNLIPVMALSWLQRSGGRPVVLVGGATGLIGDPSGKRDERQMMSEETVAANAAAIQRQLARFLDFSDAARGAVMVDNASWLRDISLLDFLRDTGKHFTVNYMLQKDSVRSRMETGISFTEFSYMLVQAYDFAELGRTLGCELQLGGSDQWGNITAGIELAARRDSVKLHGLVLPLLMTSSGAKFGKTEAGNVWLDADRTSPYAFHQFWLQVEDTDLERMLRFMTFLPLEEIAEITALHDREPGRRTGQRRLADDVTTRVHGADAVRRAGDASRILFGDGNLLDADADTVTMILAEIPGHDLAASELQAGINIVDALSRAGLASSKSDARRGLQSGGFTLNGAPVDETRVVSADDLLHDRAVLLRKGKKNWAALRATT